MCLKTRVKKGILMNRNITLSKIIMILIFLCGFYNTVIAEIYTPEKIIKDKDTGYELRLTSMLKATDNSQLLLGATQNDFTNSFFSRGKTPLHSLLIKLNSENQVDFAIEFDKYLFSDMIQGENGTIALVGISAKEPLNQLLIVKLQPDGNVVSSTLYSPKDSQKISPGKLMRVSSKGVGALVQVSTDSSGTQYGFGALKIDNSGKIDGKKFFLAKEYKKLVIKNFLQTKDKSSIVFGDIYDFNKKNSDICLIKFKEGQLLWAKVIHGTEDETILSLKEIGDQVLVAVSSTAPEQEQPTPVYFSINKDGNIDQITSNQKSPLDFPEEILKKDISPFLVKDVTIASFNVELSSKAISYQPQKVKKITPQIVNP